MVARRSANFVLRGLRDSHRLTRVNFQTNIYWYLFNLATISHPQKMVIV
jgi:hypothetical protein